MMAAPTGARMTRKARAIAARFPELGAVRHVETCPPSPKALVIAVVILLACVVGLLLGNGDVVDAVFVFPAWCAIVGVIYWYLGSEKLLVMERGLIMGSFAPFAKPYVVPFHRMNAESVSAVRPVWKLASMVQGRTSLSTGRNTVWSWNGVAFVASVSAPATPARVASVGVLDATTELPQIVWWFGTWRSTDGLVRALEDALVAFGAPGAQGLSQRALPMVKISGNPADARVQVPHLVAALDCDAAPSV